MKNQRYLVRKQALGIGGLILVAILLVMAAGRPAGSKATISAPVLQSSSAEAFNTADGAMCQWQTASASMTLAQQMNFAAAADTPANRQAISLDRPPVRAIRDEFPTYSAVAVDPIRNEIVVQDENLFQVLVYDRSANTPTSAKMTEPKRVLGGHLTKLEFNCGIYVDPKNGDIYSVNNDTLNTMTVFTREQRGDVPPARELTTPHRSFGIAVDENANELFMTVQDPPEVVVYQKTAAGNDKPIRTLRGNKTQLADALGIGLDTKNGWMFVSNFGNAAKFSEGRSGGRGQGQGENGEAQAPAPQGDEAGGGFGGGEGGGGGRIPGSGYFMPPSITVFPMKSEGDTAPLRIITGDKTKLNWPAHVYVDSDRGDVYVANDGGDSVLVFKVTDSGNVAPSRIIGGPKTLIKNPTGVYVDNINKEVVIAGMGNSSTTVFDVTANGDIPPKRIIRGAPLGTESLQIGNPGAVAYDSKRGQILVPNCVAHPQIAVFERMSKGSEPPVRKVFGQATLLSRTMHDIRYSPKRDEIYVTNPFAQAILTFKGDAGRDSAPARIIQGPKTILGSEDTLEIDDVNDELLIPSGTQILIYPVAANGDVAPSRILKAARGAGWRVGNGIAVDPIHNVIVTDGTLTGDLAKQMPFKNPYGGGRDTLLIFDRKANGEVMPLRIIRGEKTGIYGTRQIQVYPKGGWIVISQITDGGIAEPKDTYIGVFSIYDNGNVPPRWKIDGKPSNIMKKPRGITLDPTHKEVIVSDMRLNAVLTFPFPEIYDQVAKP
jgi:DNA-binding beta-propeller fold protein YncE